MQIYFMLIRDEFKRAIARKALEDDELASMAGISIRTLAKVKRCDYVTKKTAAGVAKALGYENVLDLFNYDYMS